MATSVVKARRVRWAVAAALAAALALVLVPVEATYPSEVGSDFVVNRTAKCGPAVAALLGADADVDDVPQRLGPGPARAACEATAGKRVVLSLAALLAGSFLIRRPTSA